MSGVPVLIHLPGPVFRALERIARRKGIDVRTLIAQGVTAGVERAPEGKRYRRLTPAEWAEVRRDVAAGVRVESLAKRHQCSKAAIYKHLREQRHDRQAP